MRGVAGYMSVTDKFDFGGMFDFARFSHVIVFVLVLKLFRFLKFIKDPTDIGITTLAVPGRGPNLMHVQSQQLIGLKRILVRQKATPRLRYY